MAIIRATKDVRRHPLAIEQELFALRDLTKSNRESDAFSGYKRYSKTDRKQNATSLRMLWAIYKRASTLMDLLQRVYLTQTAFRLTTLIEVLGPEGDRYEVSTALDHWRTYKPTALGDFMMYDPTVIYKRNFEDEDLQHNADFIREYCETLAQTRHKTVILSVHNPDLLKSYHASLQPDKRWSMLSVNVDKQFTWAQRERPIMLRQAMTVEAKGLSKETLLHRAGTYCDSIRLLGETLDTHGCAYDRPALNVLVAAMQELSHIIAIVTHELKELNHAIMKEASQYRGFQYVPRNVLIEEAKAIRYADGVTITNAVSPVQTRQIETLNMDKMRKLIFVGAVNLDTPILALRMNTRVNPLPRNPDYAPLWEKGRAALRKTVDPMAAKLVKANQELVKT